LFDYWFINTYNSLKRRFEQNQNDCVFTVLSLLPTLGDQILEDMNIERDWVKLQESRKLEKIELRLKKEREAAALLREEQEAMEQLKDSTVNESAKGQLDTVEVEQKDNEKPKPQLLKSPQLKNQGLDSSVGSLSSSFNAEEDRPLPEGILSKKEKHLLWEEIKTKSNVSTEHYTKECGT
jgi:peroxin-3